MHDVSRSLDMGVQTFNKVKPVLDLVAHAYGNHHVQDFNRKAQDELTANTKMGQVLMRNNLPHGSNRYSRKSASVSLSIVL